ncbi:MAG TPA: sigma-70 family RNA polymerase sigma factor [Solirubrobacterales bacterium]|jgi:RNA polymerase sigma-70 factor (ECF subfamily)
MPDDSHRDALTRLYDSYARALIVFFQRRVGDPELAVDLMSETFTSAIERLDQFRGSPETQLSGWIWSIAREVLSEHERQEAISGGSEDPADDEVLREALSKRLDLIPEEQREALRLRVIDHLSYREVAARLQITSSAARSRVERARRALRQLLDFDLENGHGR